MRAALIDAATGIDKIRVGDAPIAAPGAGEVQIEVRASSVNFPDILMSEGAYQIKPPLPFTPGMEGAGTVRAVAPDVRDFKVGDRVLASVEFGTFAERLNAPRHTMLLDSGSDFVRNGRCGRIGISDGPFRPVRTRPDVAPMMSYW